MSRSEYAAVAGLAVSQFIESFDQPENEYAKAALRFAPLLLLSPQRRGTGLESFVTDPRVVGGAAVLGIVALGQRRGRGTIQIGAPAEIVAGETARVSAVIISPSGEVVGGSVRWSTSDPSIAWVTEDGLVHTAEHKGGHVLLIATAEGMQVGRQLLHVAARPAGKSGGGAGAAAADAQAGPASSNQSETN